VCVRACVRAWYAYIYLPYSYEKKEGRYAAQVCVAAVLSICFVITTHNMLGSIIHQPASKISYNRRVLYSQQIFECLCSVAIEKSCYLHPPSSLQFIGSLQIFVVTQLMYTLPRQ